MAKAGHKLTTILVVDDDYTVLVTIQRILAQANYRVLVADEREHALRLASLRHLNIDLALLDIRMPGMPATDLAERLVSIRPNLRVVYMSGFVDEEIIRIKLHGQQVGFITKPFLRDGLINAVREALEAPARGGHVAVGATMSAGT